MEKSIKIIPVDNLTERNDLIYAGNEKGSDKMNMPKGIPNRKKKTRQKSVRNGIEAQIKTRGTHIEVLLKEKC